MVIQWYQADQLYYHRYCSSRYARVGLESYCIKNRVLTSSTMQLGPERGVYIDVVIVKSVQSNTTVAPACINCKNKPKFGGPGRKKQCCIKCKCKYVAMNSSLYQVRYLLTTDSCSTRHTTCQECKNRWHCYSTIYTHISRVPSLR